MAERHGRVLAELAELGLSLARRLHARAEAAESVEDAERLALSFHRISRSVRLSLALEARLTRERHQAWRERRSETAHAVEARKAQVRATLTREVLCESEGEAADELLDELEDRLAEDALYDQFAEGPVEACIARIREDLGLPAEAPANDADPPQAPPAPPFSLAGDGGLRAAGLSDAGSG